MSREGMKQVLQGTGERVCHAKVADVARAAAGELYESLMSSNTFFDEWKKQNPGCNAKQLEERFIRKNWGSCIEFARTTLTIMLTRDDIEEAMKDEIMVILEQDQMLRDKRVARTPLRKQN
jgi:hypothetical protein